MTARAIVAISGRIGSGKSSVAAALATRLNCRVASFGNVVRSIAANRGIQIQREELQKIGEELVAADPRAFCRAALTSVGWRPDEAVVIEGVRHVVIWEALREIAAPQPVILVHISAAADERAARLWKRTPTDLLVTVEAHSTEIDVAVKLGELADIKTDSTGRSAEETASWISEILRG